MMTIVVTPREARPRTIPLVDIGLSRLCSRSGFQAGPFDGGGRAPLLTGLRAERVRLD
jgi:hypothetical protein